MSDVIVIGLGGVGSAAVRVLARRGYNVLGIDQFEPPHDRGSSHGRTRIIRQAYFEHPGYVPLLLRSYVLWDQLCREVGMTLLHRVGLLQMGMPDGVVLTGVERSAREHHLPIERLTGVQLADRFPAIKVPAGYEGIFEPAAGYLEVENAVAAALDSAQLNRATIRTRERVLDWRADAGGVDVRTDRGTYRADRLIVAGGAWAGSILADLGLSLIVIRKTLHWFACDDARLTEASKFPAFLAETPVGIFYGFPASAEGFKVAEHSGGQIVDNPHQLHRDEEPGDADSVRNFLRDWFPTVSTTPIRFAPCMYTMSPDHHFIVDRHPRHENVVFAAGLSGHGFKFVPVLGEILVDLLFANTSTLPIDFLRLSRRAAPLTP